MKTFRVPTTCLTMVISTPDSTKPSKCTNKSSPIQVRCRSFNTSNQKLTIRLVQPDLLLSTEMMPADEQDFEKWYQQEHLIDGSKIGGWRRTERYELFNALRTDDAPKYLTLLFLDGRSVPMKDLEKAGSSEWTQKVVGSMKKMRNGMFQKSTHHTQGNKSGATIRPSSL
jgi:hypothetical protein